MNKADLIDFTARASGLTRADTKKAFDALSEQISIALQQGDEVTLPGLGKFTTTKRAARTVRSPQTGEQINVKSSIAAKFKASSVLKNKLNP